MRVAVYSLVSAAQILDQQDIGRGQRSVGAHRKRETSFENGPAVDRRGYSVTRAIKYLHPKGPLHLRDRFRDRGLRQVEVLSSLGHSASIHDLAQNTQVAELKTVRNAISGFHVHPHMKRSYSTCGNENFELTSRSSTF